jgi:hypothetical protein
MIAPWQGEILFPLYLAYKREGPWFARAPGDFFH